ncbi:MAG TPA: 3-oxoacyl-ACP reductase [Solirubrobacteraceae bacterium]|nr:3-oxoacyl-ACP reductase [Solirubrobacteraceae bacterium]
MPDVTDVYTQLVNTPIGRLVTRQVGLPAPVPLRRDGDAGAPPPGPVLLEAAPGGRLRSQLAQALGEAGAELSRRGVTGATPTVHGLVFDATGIAEPARLVDLQEFFSASIRALAPCGRAVVLGLPPADCSDPAEAIAQRSLEGFTRSLGKELRRGATAQLVYVAPGGELQLASTLRFLLSPRSAYVSGQVVRVGPGAPRADLDWTQPQRGRVALVTGASRGIGASIAATLARDGANVVGIDVPALADDLRAAMDALGGSGPALDITAGDAPQRIAAHLRNEHGGVDVVVHNAGITRDRSLGRMDAERFASVIDVNLRAPQLITDALIGDGAEPVLRPGGRVVCVSSISGIAGNAGQTNYATSKAGVIGLVDAYAPFLAAHGATINAVAPGFIETQMTASMPFALREAGRRMNSLSQGGLPVDVAETIAWLASPASGGVNGNVIRVCGQSLLGA